eukprot:GHVS01105038.1.p1 GENE.GHVS01105038.1~~GHVS01105038.1.p1  ORF type:complete len:465 (-),score=110.48 GHVS01105038.1:1289-2683(-)
MEIIYRWWSLLPVNSTQNRLMFSLLYILIIQLVVSTTTAPTIRQLQDGGGRGGGSYSAVNNLPWVSVTPQSMFPSSSPSTASSPAVIPSGSAPMSTGAVGSSTPLSSGGPYVPIDPSASGYAIAEESAEFPFPMGPQPPSQQSTQISPATSSRTNNNSQTRGQHDPSRASVDVAAQQAYARRYDTPARGNNGAPPTQQPDNRDGAEGISDEEDLAELIEFPTCADADARGYSMPYACCSIKDGDFYDPNIWHCGRVPTMLDAVFVRHFVNIADNSGGNNSRAGGELRVRALWIIDGVGNRRGRQGGVLRGGRVLNNLCSGNGNSGGGGSSLPREQIEGMRRHFRSLFIQRGDVIRDTSMASVDEMCRAFRDRNGLYRKESDFDVLDVSGSSRPVFIRVEAIGGPVPKDVAVSVAMTSVTKTVSKKQQQHEEEDNLEIANLDQFQNIKLISSNRSNDDNDGNTHT